MRGLEHFKNSNTHEYDLKNNKEIINNYDPYKSILTKEEMQEFIDTIASVYKDIYDFYPDKNEIFSMTLNTLMSNDIVNDLLNIETNIESLKIKHKQGFEITFELDQLRIINNQDFYNVFGIDICYQSVEEIYEMINEITSDFDLRELKQYIEIRNYNIRLRNKLLTLVSKKLCFESDNIFKGYLIAKTFAENTNSIGAFNVNLYEINQTMKEALLINELEEKEIQKTKRKNLGNG